ncbi:hypothetical protein OR16_30909 [Cupriavidus basilensis OR16]|uniref:Uncharacterized protein n=1 Tax=Cupriavidus basilensis OR16 TaxID=1127483 RepID=H1SD58_9BURK|nr:hypothetical protein OR16_30909 [Cupriavidus basilensis OR16]
MIEKSAQFHLKLIQYFLRCNFPFVGGQRLLNYRPDVKPISPRIVARKQAKEASLICLTRRRIWHLRAGAKWRQNVCIKMWVPYLCRIPLPSGVDQVC